MNRFVLSLLLRRRLVVLACVFLPLTAVAQHEPVFPDLSGDTLISALRQQFRPEQVFSYADARDTLFSKILAREDSLSCLYTGYTIYLDPALDPTEAAFALGINTEHLWPRSKGASHIQAEADMHHIYPTRENVNSDRGNLPFNDVPDAQTIAWYYLDRKQANRPATDIDLYSELGASFFEPVEARKGDVARAMFYFYTMYRAEADAADPAFFGVQREAFCRWHEEDPVDEAEWEKNRLIGIYQGGHPNPFILDCTLPQRTYCSGILCTPASSGGQAEKSQQASLRLSVYPQPAGPDARYAVELQSGGHLYIAVYDLRGQRLFAAERGWQPAGRSEGSFGEWMQQGHSPVSAVILQVSLSNADGWVQDSQVVLLGGSN